jgi:hypothetical protein
LINALIVVLSSASGIWDLCCMNLLTKFRNGSLSACSCTDLMTRLLFHGISGMLA